LNYVEALGFLEGLPSTLEMLEYSQEFGSKNGNVTEVGVIGNFTLEPLNPSLQYFGGNTGFDTTAKFGDFDNAQESILRFSDLKSIYYILSIESISNNHMQDVIFQDRDWFRSLIDSKLREIEIAFSSYEGRFYIGYVSNPTLYPKSKIDLYLSLTEQVRRWLSEFEKKHQNISVFQPQLLLEATGISRSFKNINYLSNSAVLTSLGYMQLSKSIVREILLANENLVKVICVDADETIWGGILGEAGPEGVLLSKESGVGRVFHTIQSELLYLRKQGVLLCLVTKNEPNDISEIISTNQHMVLTRDDFAIISASWMPKSNAIKEIADTLNLSLDSFYFIDDSPVEIESIRMILPQVRTVTASKDKNRYLLDILRLVEVVDLQYSNGDGDRTTLYRQKASVDNLEKNSNSREDFLVSLESRIQIFNNPASASKRISELSQRTNQFNFCLNRYSENQIVSMMNNPEFTFWVGEVGDRFGSHGQTLCILAKISGKQVKVVDFWASCRILGREIESEFLLAIVKYYSENGIESIELTYLPGPKNQQILDFMGRFQAIVRGNLKDHALTIECPTEIFSTQLWSEVEFVRE
jgi:FkbH-like protein